MTTQKKHTKIKREKSLENIDPEDLISIPICVCADLPIK